MIITNNDLFEIIVCIGFLSMQLFLLIFECTTQYVF